MPYKSKKDQAEAGRRHYQKYRDAYLNRTRKRRKKLLDIVLPLKRKPCTDCGKKFPYYVMDFDHREGEKKLDDINRLIRNSGKVAVILNEIEKCDLVCANCHRIRTYKRRTHGSNSS